MSRWSDQFKAHPFFEIFSQLSNILAEIELPENTQPEICLELARLKKVLQFVSNYLDACDSEFFPLHILDQMKGVSEGVRNQVNQYVSNKNEGSYLRNANDEANQLIGHLASIPTMVKAPDAFNAGLTSYQQIIQTYLGQVKTQTDSILSDVQNQQDTLLSNLRTQHENLTGAFNQLQTNFTQQSESFTALKSSIEQEINTFRQTVQAEQTLLRQGLEKISSDFQGTFTQSQEQHSRDFGIDQETRSKEFTQNQDQRNKDYIAVQEMRAKEFSHIVEKYDTKMDSEFSNLTVKASTIIEVLEKFKDQAKQVLGVVVNTAQAGVYKTYADEEKKTANFFRRYASLLMLFAIAILIGPEVKSIFLDGIRNTEFDWHNWLYRVPVALILFAPTFYFSKESTKHRNNEVRNRKMQHILTTVDPYLELLDGGKKNELKAELARQLFNPNGTDNAPSNEDEESLLRQLITFFSKLNRILPRKGE